LTGVDAATDEGVPGTVVEAAATARPLVSVDCEVRGGDEAKGGAPSGVRASADGKGLADTPDTRPVDADDAEAERKGRGGRGDTSDSDEAE